MVLKNEKQSKKRFENEMKSCWYMMSVSGGIACQTEGQAVMWRGVVCQDNLI